VGDGELSLADALLLCELLANTDPQRYERAALRWLERFIEERLPPLTEVALAASALAEAREGVNLHGLEIVVASRSSLGLGSEARSPAAIVMTSQGTARGHSRVALSVAGR
jgi:hypothetical protein